MTRSDTAAIAVVTVDVNAARAVTFAVTAIAAGVDAAVTDAIFDVSFVLVVAVAGGAVDGLLFVAVCGGVDVAVALAALAAAVVTLAGCSSS